MATTVANPTDIALNQDGATPPPAPAPAPANAGQAVPAAANAITPSSLPSVREYLSSRRFADRCRLLLLYSPWPYF